MAPTIAPMGPNTPVARPAVAPATAPAAAVAGAPTARTVSFSSSLSGRSPASRAAGGVSRGRDVGSVMRPPESCAGGLDGFARQRKARATGAPWRGTARSLAQLRLGGLLRHRLGCGPGCRVAPPAAQQPADAERGGAGRQPAGRRLRCHAPRRGERAGGRVSWIRTDRQLDVAHRPPREGVRATGTVAYVHGDE